MREGGSGAEEALEMSSAAFTTGTTIDSLRSLQGGGNGSGGLSAGGVYPTDEEILGITSDDGGASPGTAQGAEAGEGEVFHPGSGGAGSGAQDDSAEGRTQHRRDADGSVDSLRSPQAEAEPGWKGPGSKDPGYRTGETTQHAVPEWMRPLLTDANGARTPTGAKIEALWDQHQAYRELFPTVGEARALRELLPGGAEGAKRLVAEAEEIAAMDQAYYSGDPRAQAQLAANLIADDPRAFQAMLRQSAQVLSRRDPAAYHELASSMVVAALQGELFDRHVELMRQARDRGDANALARLTDQLVEWAQRMGVNTAAQRNGGARAAGENSGGAQPPSAPLGTSVGSLQSAQKGLQAAGLRRGRDELTREQAEFARERGEFAAAQYAAFQQSANDTVVAQVRQAIEQAVARAVPGSVAGGARQRMAEQVFNDINLTLQNDRGLTRQVAEILQPWNFNDATRQQVVSLIFGRAKSLVPGVAKRVIGEWTSSALAAHREKTAKQEAAARRVDIAGGGAPESIGRKPLDPRRIDYSKTSDDEILSM